MFAPLSPVVQKMVVSLTKVTLHEISSISTAVVGASEPNPVPDMVMLSPPSYHPYVGDMPVTVGVMDC